MLFQWCFHGHWTLLTSISLLALPLSLFLLCFLFHRRLRNDEVSLPPTQRTEEREEEEETASSSMVSSSEDDGHHGDSGSNQKREFVICAVCASRLVVSGPNRTWAPAAAIEDGRLKREQGDFVVCASSLAASSGGNGKTGEEEEADFVVCTSRLAEQSGGDETGEEKAAIDDGKSRKKVGFAIRDGKSSSSVSASIIDQVESSQKQELVVRTSKSAVQIGGMGTEAAIINGQETNPNEEELGPDSNQESAVDEFFSCVSSMVPIVTGGSEAGAAIDLVRLSIGEVEEEGELGSCSKLLMAIDDEDDDDEQHQEEKEESLVVNASSLAPGKVSGG